MNYVRGECKLCFTELTPANVCMADLKLCKTCYSDLGFARRYVKKTSHTIEEASRMMVIMDKIRTSAVINGFVPKFYKAYEKEVSCRTCGTVFKTPTESLTCSQCELRATVYSNTLARGKVTPNLIEIRKFYAQALFLGYYVPKCYLEDPNRKEV